MSSEKSIVILGYTGAVGKEVVRTLLQLGSFQKITLLGRHFIKEFDHENVRQYQIDIFDPPSYLKLLDAHESAICTLGVGQPSKISKEDFVKIDRDAVLNFASGCKHAGIKHFELLASVGSNAQSTSYYLRIKGELEDGLGALQFDRLSLFRPSIILTPSNRYGISQGILLRLFPILNPLLFGSLSKYRGIPVELLGSAIARNIFCKGQGQEILYWTEIMDLMHDGN